MKMFINGGTSTQPHMTKAAYLHHRSQERGWVNLDSKPIPLKALSQSFY